MGLFKSVVGKLKKGLDRTRETFVGGLRSMLSGRTLDDALIDDLERALIQADVGVATTQTLITSIRADYKAGKLTKGEDVLDYLKAELKTRWPAADRELRLADAGPTVILVTGVNGAGKTTSIAKLCGQLRSENKTVLLGAAIRSGPVPSANSRSGPSGWASRSSKGSRGATLPPSRTTRAAPPRAGAWTCSSSTPRAGCTPRTR